VETLRDTIKEITRKHLEENNGLIMGQCLSAIGWVNGTVPDTKNVVELPMTDIAGAAFAVGAAVAGRRPILVIRFQDFLLLNNSSIINFAAKRRDIWGKPVPLFVRALAIEGNGTGPTHSGKLHSTFCHFPGLRIWCPITSSEWQTCWEDFMKHDDPTICFEHRLTFDNDYEYDNIIKSESEITIFAIGYAREKAMKAMTVLEDLGYKPNFINIVQLKPFNDLELCLEALNKSKVGLVVDCGFEICSFASELAFQLMLKSNKKVHILGLEDKSVGCSKATENATPNEFQIVRKAREIMGRDNAF
jgi:acetoin:2,6-dichlorophenolindophenol oxidoreductase subunit beta